MSAFVYIVTEGVHDVAFLGKLLTVCHGASRVRRLDKLSELCKDWIGSFTWPLRGPKYVEIDRLSVPAPVFYGLPTGGLVALRNAQGISNICNTLERDLEFFDRRQGGPEAIALVLDSDDEPAEQRFQDLTAKLVRVNLTASPVLGQVTAGPPRVGVFALPEPGAPGTLEDVLLALGDVAYPELTAAARAYSDQWRTTANGDPTRPDWKEIRKPAGAKKATIGAMTAVLKPGKSTQVSLEDNHWVCHETRLVPILQPCMTFLHALLASNAPIPASLS